MAESAQDPEVPITTGANMSVERQSQEGVKPIEQMQVSRAAEEAQKNIPPWGSSVEAVRTFGAIRSPEDLPESVKAVKNPVAQEGEESPEDILARTRADIAGFDVEGTGGLLPSADRMLELQRRMAEQERYYEGSRIAETLRTSEDSDEITLEVRRQVGIVESNIDDARYNNLSMIARQLQDRAQTFRDAVDPRTREILKTGLQRRGLTERSVAVQERLRRILGRDRWEIDVNDEEKEVLVQAAQGQELVVVPNPTSTENPHRVRLNGTQLDKMFDSDDAEKIVRGTTELKVTPSKSEAELRELANVCETLAKEISTRQRLFLGYSMYEPAKGQITELAAGLFENYFYSARITVGDWANLAEMGPSLPGEREFGDKWEMGMRIYGLLGELGGSKKNEDGTSCETFEDKKEATRKLIDEKLGKKSWFEDWLNNYIGSEEKQKDFKDGLAYNGAKNLFSSGYPQRDAKAAESWQKGTRNWVAGWLGEDRDDNRAAEELSWRSFFMMGHPSYFDGMTGTVAGAPATGDDIKTQHPDNWRDREHSSNHDAGPLATIGKYDKAAEDFGVLGGKFTIMVPFLQYCLPMEDANGKEILVEKMKSFWERWWEEGEHFKDLPLRAFREYAWQYWLLFPGYFGGGYGHRNQQSYEKSLFWLITNDEWKRDPLINVGTLKSIFRTTKYGLGGWAVTRGNVQGWLREVNKKPKLVNRFGSDIKKAHDKAKQEWEKKRDEARKEWEKGPKDKPFKFEEFEKFLIKDENTGKTRVKERVEELNASEFEEVVVNPLRQRVRELILVGAISTSYQNSINFSRTAEEWGLFYPGLGQEKSYERPRTPIEGTVKRDLYDDTSRLIKSVLDRSKYDVDLDKIKKEAGDYLRKTSVRTS